MTEFSYQLYSSRNFGPISETLAQLAQTGYIAVEGYGALYQDIQSASRLAGIVQEHGLAMPSGHFGLDMLEDDPGLAIKIAQVLGIKEVFAPFLMPEDRPDSTSGWAAFGKRLSKASRPIVDAGLEFGWHNHDFEFTPLADGTLPIDVILGADEGLMFEFDVAWAVVAGANPLVTIEKYGSRIRAAHIKDRATTGKTEEDGWADVGDGVIEWPKMMARLKSAGTEIFVMEHDNPSDDMRFARNSLAHAKTLF